MIPYIIGWLLVYMSLLLWSAAEYRGRLFIAVTLIYLCVITVIRGDVGTDTLFYENLLQLRNLGHEGPFWEVAFWTPLATLARVVDSEQYAIRFVGILFFGILLIYLYRSTEDERFVLVSYVIPVFAYQYGMNALRLGIASIFILIVTQELSRRNSSKMIPLLVLPNFIHITTFLSSVFIVSIIYRGAFLKKMIGVLILLILGGIASIVLEKYFENKLDVYEIQYAPSSASGISKIIVIITLMGGVASGRLPIIIKTNILLFTAVFSVFAAFVVVHSFAGLRLLDLISFALPVAILCSYKLNLLQFDKNIKTFFVIAGILGSLAVYRNIILEPSDSESPFFPYRTFLSE